MKNHYTGTHYIKTVVLLATALFIFQFLKAQSSFRKVCDGTEFDYGNCVIQTPDNGICIVGSTNSYGSGNYDIYVIRLDSNAQLQWSKTFDWGKNEYGLSATVTSDKGIAITGYSNISKFSDSAWDCFVLKLDARGNAIWCKSIAAPKEDNANGITQNARGDLIIAGSTRSYGKGANDIYLAKLTSAGELLWTKTLGTPYEDIAYSITLTKNGFAIAGAADGFMPFLAKLDTDGNILWNKIITQEGSSIGSFNSVAQTNDNGFVATGFIKTNNRGYDQLIVRMAAAGTVEWGRVSGNEGDDKGNSVVEDKKGNLILTGYYDYARVGFAQSLDVAKINHAGKLLWNKTITEQFEAIGSSIISSAKGGYVATGSVWQTIDGYLYKPDIYLAKFDTEGGICGAAVTQNNMQNFIPYIPSLNFNQSQGGNLISNIVKVYNGGFMQDHCILTTLSQHSEDQLNTDKRKVPSNAINAAIAPNPVKNNDLGIHFNGTNATSLLLNIVSIEGRVMMTKKLNLPAQTWSTNINIAALPAGVYVLKLSDNTVSQTIKFIKDN
ncbi:MAG TPA: T9SS type A sorting domain-containing protein [Panacibacter sp.]|nr:T9SS type A sorting domain-containing protein [Panacibacter sp.]